MTDTTIGASAPAVAVAPAVVPVVAPLPAAINTPAGQAGLEQYAGDLGTAVAPYLPKWARAVIYPAGYLLSTVLVSLAAAHVGPSAVEISAAFGVSGFASAIALSHIGK